MTNKENQQGKHASYEDSVPNVINLEKYSKNIYDQISEKSGDMKPGESLSYTREIKGIDFRVDFYPKGLIARRDIPHKVNLTRDYRGSYSYLWKPDYGEYCNDDNIPGKKALEEIVQLDMSLTPEEHELRFYYNCPKQAKDRTEMYRKDALNHYTRSNASLMLIRDADTHKLLGFVGVARHRHEKDVYELGLEIAEEARGKGIAAAAIDDLASILKAGGAARRIEGNYLFTHGRKNEACNGLFIKKRDEARQGISRIQKVELRPDPNDPEYKKFIITL